MCTCNFDKTYFNRNWNFILFCKWYYIEGLLRKILFCVVENLVFWIIHDVSHNQSSGERREIQKGTDKHTFKLFLLLVLISFSFLSMVACWFVISNGRFCKSISLSKKKNWFEFFFFYLHFLTNVTSS